MEIVNLEKVLQRMYPGAVIVQPYFKMGVIQTLNGGTAGVPSTLDFVNEALPAGTGLLLTDLFANLIDNIGSDFCFFNYMANGIAAPGAESPIFGVQGTELRAVSLLAVIPPSALATVRATNRSGTGNDALGKPYPPTTAARVCAGVKGWLWRIQDGVPDPASQPGGGE